MFKSKPFFFLHLTNAFQRMEVEIAFRYLLKMCENFCFCLQIQQNRFASRHIQISPKKCKTHKSEEKNQLKQKVQ